MYIKETKMIKCNNCGKQILESFSPKDWSTRKYVEKLEVIQKHFCPSCTKMYGFYANGILLK